MLNKYLLAIASGLLFSSQAFAGLITINYTGTITSLGLFGADATVMEGSYTFEMTQSDSDMAGDKAKYVAVSNSITIKDSGGAILYTSLTGTTSLEIKVENKSGEDKYKMEDKDTTGRNGFGMQTFQSSKLDLKDSTHLAFSNAEFGTGFLPLSIDLNDFDTIDWDLKFTGGGSNDTKGILTSMSVAAVPVPAAVWLMGSALAGLFGFARRK